MPEAPLFFLIAGEASGDLLGARLMQGLKKATGGEARFAGIGGPRMRAEGLELFFRQEELAHFGLFELLRHVPHLIQRMQETVAEVKRLQPAALITIDAPDFCFRVARRLKSAGIPLIHYVAPTVWAWRPGRAHKLAGFLDHLLALLPFEPPYFACEGLDCTFVGHSIIESMAGQGDGARFRAKYGIGINSPLLVALPGSRMSEVTRLLPVYGETVARLRFQHPQLHVAIPIPSNLFETAQTLSQDWGVPVTITITDEDKYDAFAAAGAALACSGTVAVELAMARLPSVTAYKMNPVTVLLYRRLIKMKYANLVNIMHDQPVVPEFLQENCKPEKLSSAIHTLLTSDMARQKQITGLQTVAGWLGQGHFVPSERAAQTVLAVISELKERQSRAKPFAVLQVVPALSTGGVERGTVEMARALIKAGHRAVVASAGGSMVRDIEDARGTHVTLPLNSKNPFTIHANIERLENIIRRQRIDIVHARSRAPAWSAWYAARRTGRPFVTTFHNAYGAESLPKRYYNLVMAKGARVIAISHFVADYAARLYGVSYDRLRVIPRGVDIKYFDPATVESSRMAALRREWHVPEGVPVILLPGRFTRWKGQLVLIEALAQLGRHDVHVFMVGGGSRQFRQEIEALAVSRGVASTVHIVENCRDMPAAYRLADMVVSPSTRPEGFGRVIAEAQAMGIPVIATDHGGARETVIPGETGWLVPPGDAGALAAAITQVLALPPAQKTALAIRSMDHIRAHFTTSMMTDATLAVYGELLHAKEPAPASMAAPRPADAPPIQKIPGKERILVIRLGALGDLILCFQAFHEIRQAHPDAEIALLTMPAFADFARRMPWFDRVIVDLRPGAAQLGQWLRLIKDVHAFAPDRVYDLQGKLRQSLLFMLLGGPFLGLQWSGAAPLCSHPRLDPPTPGMHFTEFVAAQLQLADVPPQPPADVSWLGDPAEAPLDKFSLPERYAVLIPGCATHREYKRWPAENYARLAQKLKEQGITCVAVGTRQDAATVAAIRSVFPEVVDLTGRTSLLQLAALMRGAVCVVANDTGPMHIAAAVGAPVLALMSERVDAAWNAPKGPQAKWLQGHPLAELDVEKVLLALADFLDQNK